MMRCLKNTPGTISNCLFLTENTWKNHKTVMAVYNTVRAALERARIDTDASDRLYHNILTCRTVEDAKRVCTNSMNKWFDTATCHRNTKVGKFRKQKSDN